MKNGNINIKKEVALISTPWPIYNRPSIQLGMLKAALLQKFPNQLNVDSFHFYLDIAEKADFMTYQEISEKSWLAESVYASLLYPEKAKEVEALFNRESLKCKNVKKRGFNEIVEIVKKVSDNIIDSIEWDKYLYAGFSICICQLTSSLYFINRIKSKYPALPVVAGGSILSGLKQNEIFSTFKNIDYIINGEGELPLIELTSRFLNENFTEFSSVSGLFSNKEKNNKSHNKILLHQIDKLDKLPVPDFDDYYKTLNQLPPQKRFFPNLPVEMSRGCWWNKKADNNLAGCAFCNLNMQWKSYRAKSEKRIINEIDVLTSKYKTLSISFMDNLIPLNKNRQLFNNINELGKDFSFFCEIRANTSYKDLISMKKAGVRNVQVGIEALSSNLLYKINKGTTAIENLEIMKNCEATGIKSNSNLILHFPKSDEDDVSETLNAIDYAEIFRPLTTVRFQLGLGSPVMTDSKAFNIKSVNNHKNYSHLFPNSITSSIQFLNQTYTGDIGFQKKLWQPVKKRVAEWEKSYKKLHSKPYSTPILSYKDGKDFLIIKKRKENGEHDTHRLTGPSAKIYLFCEKRKTLNEIKADFSSISTQAIFSFLSMMSEKKLMFHDNDEYLSLACKEK